MTPKMNSVTCRSSPPTHLCVKVRLVNTTEDFLGLLVQVGTLFVTIVGSLLVSRLVGAGSRRSELATELAETAELATGARIDAGFATLASQRSAAALFLWRSGITDSILQRDLASLAAECDRHAQGSTSTHRALEDNVNIAISELDRAIQHYASNSPKDIRQEFEAVARGNSPNAPKDPELAYWWLLALASNPDDSELRANLENIRQALFDHRKKEYDKFAEHEHLQERNSARVDDRLSASLAARRVFTKSNNDIALCFRVLLLATTGAVLVPLVLLAPGMPQLPQESAWGALLLSIGSGGLLARYLWILVTEARATTDIARASRIRDLFVRQDSR